MSKFFLLTVFIFVGIWFLFGTDNASAETFAFNLSDDAANSSDNPLGDFPGEDLEASDVTRILVGFACWLTRTAMILPFIFLVLAGFQFMNAKGDHKKFQSAEDNFKTVIIGILVIYAVYVIIATVANAVGITDFSFIPLVC